jgi:heme/copper-type cytochrome/quinol oxidase subunit 2
MVTEVEQIDDKERSLLIEAKREAARSFDQTMITLSAGALGLSLTFVQQLATKPAQWRALLSLAWVCFGVALVAILVSFILFMYAIDARIRCDKRKERRWDKGARQANWTSLIAFTLGVVTLLLFSVKNFLR